MKIRLFLDFQTDGWTDGEYRWSHEGDATERTRTEVHISLSYHCCCLVFQIYKSICHSIFMHKVVPLTMQDKQ